MASTIILFIFAALSAGSYGGGTINGVLQALTAWRFLLGIGIGYVTDDYFCCCVPFQWMDDGLTPTTEANIQQGAWRVPRTRAN